MEKIIISNYNRFLFRMIFFLLSLSSFITIQVQSVFAEYKDDIVVVSLGDSFSSGEGIEPFYGQDQDWKIKVEDDNWVAHRSTKSWGSMLEIPGVEGTLGDYFTEKYKYDTTTNIDSTTQCRWYFKAASGAVTADIKKEQKKKFSRWVQVETTPGDYGITGDFIRIPLEHNLPPQIEVFDTIDKNDETVNYVILTIGGNDIDFEGIIKTCLFHRNTDRLVLKINNTWQNIESIMENIQQVYVDISKRVSEDTIILVVGYPKLLSKNGGNGIVGSTISKAEAILINEKTTEFNNLIKEKVDECNRQGMNIYFIDVENEFDENGGHGAYTSDAWLNHVIVPGTYEDLNYPSVGSTYSIHPNEKGAEAYARCVNKKIDELESQKGTISGKVASASDDKAIAGAKIEIYKIREESVVGEILWTTLTSDETGYYSTALPAGNYKLEISADKYITFSAYATITEGNTEYMETFLMVVNGDSRKGTVSGIVSDATTGNPIGVAAITVRRGWNNIEYGDVLANRIIESSDNGEYQLNLDAGNYTFYIESFNYTSTYINVAVRPEGGTIAKATLTPSAFNGYRIVLTWKSEPKDLDAHMAEYMASKKILNVFFGNKLSERVQIDKCVLDVDEQYGYGPETITLETYDTHEQKGAQYYYYVHLFSRDGTLSSSNAQVKIYKGGELIATRNVPTNLGSGRYWNVFAIVDEEIIFKDTITNSADLTYAIKKSEERSTLMLATAILATDSDAMIATDSDAILATGSEAMVDIDDETLHDKYDAIKEDIGYEDSEKDSGEAEDTYEVLLDGEVVMDIEMKENVDTDEVIASYLPEEKMKDEKSEMDVADVADEDVERETSSDTDKTDAVGDEPIYMATPSNAA